MPDTEAIDISAPVAEPFYYSYDEGGESGPMKITAFLRLPSAEEAIPPAAPPRVSGPDWSALLSDTGWDQVWISTSTVNNRTQPDPMARAQAEGYRLARQAEEADPLAYSPENRKGVTALRGMFDNPRQVDAVEPRLEVLGPYLQDADTKRKRAVITRYLSHKTGLSVSQAAGGYEMLKVIHGKQQGWENIADDNAFFENARHVVKKEEDEERLYVNLQDTALDNAIHGMSGAEAWTKWQASAKGIPGWSEGRLAQYQAEFMAQHAVTAARATELEPEADDIIYQMQWANDADRERARAYFHSKSPEDAALLYKLVETRAREKGKSIDMTVFTPEPRPHYSEAAKVGFRVLDTIPRVVGGVLAGGDQAVQHQYQRSPFTPFRWMFNYEGPPREGDAVGWTTAQLAFNDAFEAGLVTKNTPVGPGGRVTVSRPPSSGDDGLGIFYVQEHAPRKSTAPVEGHEFSYAPKAEMVTSGRPMPALGYKKGGAAGNSYMRFNDADVSSRTVYDAEWSNRSATRKEDVQSKVDVLRQNPGWSLVVEVPDKDAQDHAAKLYNDAVAMVKPGEAMPLVSIVVSRPETAGPRVFQMRKEAVRMAALAQHFSDFGMKSTHAGAFFGWGSVEINKHVSSFTKDALVAAGWNKERLLRIARGYRTLEEGTSNKSAPLRAEQLENLAKLFDD